LSSGDACAGAADDAMLLLLLLLLLLPCYRGACCAQGRLLVCVRTRTSRDAARSKPTATPLRAPAADATPAQLLPQHRAWRRAVRCRCLTRLLPLLGQRQEACTPWNARRCAPRHPAC
jgi:hypothetical protein